MKTTDEIMDGDMGMRRGWNKRGPMMAIAGMAALLAIATPAAAQFSESFNFLKAVRDRDGGKVSEAVEKPGSQIINTKDYTTGEAALHILVKRRDTGWIAYLLSKGATADVRDKDGNTPLLLATQLDYAEGVRVLLSENGGVNTANARGETPIIMAVQNRDPAMVRLLLANGADPRRADRIAGKSARDYAAEDARSAAILKLLDATPVAKPTGPVSGPVR